MNIFTISEHTARHARHTFYQACEHCPNAHRDRDVQWGTCGECAEEVCDDCAQPGTRRDEERGDDGAIHVTCICRRCAVEAQ